MMRRPGSLTMLAQRWPRTRRRRRGDSGAAAIEFALLSPIMVTMLVGTIELTNAIRVQAKLNVTAGQLAELVAGQSFVVAGSAAAQASEAGVLADMCKGAAWNMLPYDFTKVSASIASITDSVSGSAVAPVQDWESDTSCTTAASHAGYSTMLAFANSPRSLFTQDGSPWPGSGGSGAAVLGYSAIIVRVQYAYSNVLTHFLAQNLVFTAVAVARPRSNTAIICTTTPVGSAGSAPCPQNN